MSFQCLIKPQVKENTRPIDLKLHSDTRAVERAEFDQQVILLTVLKSCKGIACADFNTCFALSLLGRVHRKRSAKNLTESSLRKGKLHVAQAGYK